MNKLGTDDPVVSRSALPHEPATDGSAVPVDDTADAPNGTATADPADSHDMNIAPRPAGRPRLAPGEHGEPWVQRISPGKYAAKVRFRARDGRVREISARGVTKSTALRELTRRLEEGRSSGYAVHSLGVVPSMTVSDLGVYWLQHRERHGLQRQRGAVKPQTLAAYSDAIRLVINPNLGEVRVHELTVGLLESVLGDVEQVGLSTAQARSALNQMLGLAVRHGALPTNPMVLVAKPLREPKEVHALTVEQARTLRALVSPATQRNPGKRGPNRDLADLVDVHLGTGCRIGEVLALTWAQLELTAVTPSIVINGTLVEPKVGYVDSLHRQDSTKNNVPRTLILPDHVVALLHDRHAQSAFTAPSDPVFASGRGTWLWPNNLRTRLRTAVANDPDLEAVTPHTLRRTVGTLIAHEAGLDAAREVLGHTDGSVTYQSYVARRTAAPDVRHLLDQFFT